MRWQCEVIIVVLYPNRRTLKPSKDSINAIMCQWQSRSWLAKPRLSQPRCWALRKAPACLPSHSGGHFPSLEALEACAASKGGKQTIAHAVSISSGGEAILIGASEETLIVPEVESARRNDAETNPKHDIESIHLRSFLDVSDTQKAVFAPSLPIRVLVSEPDVVSRKFIERLRLQSRHNSEHEQRQ
jgi:hypothetical protein